MRMHYSAKRGTIETAITACRLSVCDAGGGSHRLEISETNSTHN